MTDQPQTTRNAGGGVIGLVIMLIGITLLLDRAGIVRIEMPYRAFWGVVVITIGLVKLSQVRPDGRRTGGWWLLFGAWMLLNELHIWRFKESWPLLIVAAGLNMVWKEMKGPRSRPQARVE
ncbi:MAG: LiaF transmembrane domain-containing protein [Vicinamibacterales bacterium]